MNTPILTWKLSYDDRRSWKLLHDGQETDWYVHTDLDGAYCVRCGDRLIDIMHNNEHSRWKCHAVLEQAEKLYIQRECGT